jgi:hypothetical protein
MRKSAVILFPIVLFACFGCNSTVTREDVRKYENQVFSAYFTNDIHHAESALLKGLETIAAYEKCGDIDGVDFNAHKAMFHERLFLIYQKQQETNKAELEFRRSMDCINLSRRSYGAPPLSYTRIEFEQMMKNLDPGRNIRWQHE